MLACIVVLRERGLTSAMVALDFFHRRLDPLQALRHPAWMYASDDGECHMVRDPDSNLPTTTLEQWVQR